MRKSKRVSPFLVTALLAAAILTAACCRAVERNELIGTWHLTKESRAKLPETARSDDATLILNGDGTFRAHRLPGDLVDEGEHSISGTGRWEFLHDERRVRLSIATISGGTRNVVPYTTQVEVAATRRGLTLYHFIGDPDEHNIIEFEKREVAAAGRTNVAWNLAGAGGVAGAVNGFFNLPEATVNMVVTNGSNAASGFRPPVLGYTEFWKNNVAPRINSLFETGPLSETTQTFTLTVPCR